jgi:hypothetical protein
MTQDATQVRRLVDHYRAMIDGTDFGTVRRYFEHPHGEIREVILVGAGENLAEIAARLDCPSEVRSTRGLELCRRGAIRFAVERPEDVPEPWAPFATRLDDIPSDRWCRVIYAPPAYLVEFAA